MTKKKSPTVKPTIFLVEDSMVPEGYRIYSTLRSLFADFGADELPQYKVTRINLETGTRSVGSFIVDFIPEEV